MTFPTDATCPCAGHSQGWKCDTCEGKKTFPPEASVSVCDAAHIQALLFLDGSISAATLVPWSSNPTSQLRRPERAWFLMPEVPAEASGGGAAGRGGVVFKQDGGSGKIDEAPDQYQRVLEPPQRN